MKKKLHEFIQNNLLVGEEIGIGVDDNLFELGLDSLKLMKLVNFLEDEYQVSIPYEKVNPKDLRTISTISSLIEELNVNC